MLDEPLGSLDKNLRERLVGDLRTILKACQQTALYVTHDQEEAFVIADRVVVMSTARIEQIGAPQQIYRRPASPFVARFLGFNNLFPGEIKGNIYDKTLETPIGTFPYKTKYSGPATILLRPDSVEANTAGKCSISGMLEKLSFRGLLYRIVISIKDTKLEFHLPSKTTPPKPGETISLSFDPENAFQIFPSKE
jgi:ABC-type Fe3+/spermidine/putrescine transport system ATPase subunit